MKVAIDARSLGSQHGGDETYIRNVIRSLAAIDPNGDYTLYLVQPLPDERLPPGAERMRRVVVPDKPFRRTPILIPLRAAREHIDVIHAEYAGPPLATARVVLTLHDVSWERNPQWFTRTDLLYMRAFVPPTARRAAAILTLSEYSKQDIVRRYCVPPEKIVVTYLAADPMFRPIRDDGQLAAVRERYRTGERFILCVGNLQPRKNLSALIDAYMRLRRADATRHKLVLVGRKGWLYDDTFAAARDSGYADDLVFTDYVPDEDLVALYNAAELFVYPSLFEGFGIPPLEAMACGTPVVTSNTTALPEVVGDAALTVDPRNVEALGEAISRVLDDVELRARLSVKGMRRASAFSWEDTARKIHNVYRQVSRRR